MRTAALAFVCSTSLVLSIAVGPVRGEDAAAAIRPLVPTATGMVLADFDKLAMAPTTPKQADVESKSLTLILLTLRVTEDDTAAQRREFRYLVEKVVKPVELAEEMSRYVRGRGRLRVALGPVTMIQEDRITDLAAKVEGDTATGWFEYEVPKLYAGRVEYTARRVDDTWRIERFRMPARGVEIVRGENGSWNRVDPESK